MAKHKGYRLTVKVRNNLLLRAIEQRGEQCGPNLAKKMGVPYQNGLLDYINCKISPLDADGCIKPDAEKIIEWLHVRLDEVFSDEHLYVINQNVSEIEIGADEISAFLPSYDPVLMLENDDVKKRVDSLLAKIPCRDADILRLRFGLEGESMRREEISNKIGVTVGGVQFLERRAIHALGKLIKKEDANFTSDLIELSQS